MQKLPQLLQPGYQQMINHRSTAAPVKNLLTLLLHLSASASTKFHFLLLRICLPASTQPVLFFFLIYPLICFRLDISDNILLIPCLSLLPYFYLSPEVPVSLISWLPLYSLNPFLNQI